MWFEVGIEGKDPMDKDEDDWGGRLEFGFSEKNFSEEVEDYFLMFEDQCTQQSHNCGGRVRFFLYPTSGRKLLILQTMTQEVSWSCWTSTRMGTSVTVGGGKWTLRNGIFNHKIFNDIWMITFDFCFMKYKQKNTGTIVRHNNNKEKFGSLTIYFEFYVNVYIY